MYIQLLLVLVILCANNVLALKGLKRNSSLRLLQNGPPVAGGPDEGVPTPKEGTPKVVPKMDPKGDVLPKDKKGKKCKKAKSSTTPPPSNEPEVRQLQGEEPMMEIEYCLQGDATEAECQAAMTGKLPTGHQRIKADVKVDINFASESSQNEVLNKVEQIFKSETAAEFIGCDDKNRRLAGEATGADNSTSTEEVRVTGVDFKTLKTDSQGMIDPLCVHLESDWHV